MSNESLNKDFENAVGNELDFHIKGADITLDNLEVILDSVINDGLLKDIPIIRNLAAIGKIYSSVKERHFIKKIVLFLNETKTISNKEKEHFEKKYLSTDKDKQRFYEKLLFILDKSDDVEKAQIIAYYFKTLIHQEIELQDFILIIRCVENMDINTMTMFLKDSFNWDEMDIEAFDGYNEMFYTELQNEGMIYISFSVPPFVPRHGSSSVELKNRYRLTDLGRQMLKYNPYTK